MTDPKRRSPAALRAHQRQRQAGGPHDEGRTRGEEERMAIAEELEDQATIVDTAGDEEGARQMRAAIAELDRLAAENAELRGDNQTLRGIIKGRVLQLDRLAAENAAWRELAARMLPEVESNMGLVAGLTDVVRDMLDGVSSGGHSGDRLAAENAELRATVEGDAELLASVGRRLKRLAMGPSDDGLGDECVARAALTDARIRAALDGGGEMGEGGE